jgi:hypothetical protein
MSKYNALRDWLAQIEHELIERGMSSLEATETISKNELALQIKFDSEISVRVASDFCAKN